MDLSQFGIGERAQQALSHSKAPSYPPPVPGRVAHIDADFMAYQVSAESKAELDPDDPTPRKTLDDMRHNAGVAVDHVRQMARAEHAVLHVTTDKTKGGRDEIAIQREYQANRNGKEKPYYLNTIRDWLAAGAGMGFEGINHTDQEADDGLAQALWKDPENCILCSADKDLLMVPGWKLDMYSGEITKEKDEFGYIKYDDKKKKVVGRGTKFFWAQVLMGDTADNIQGVPFVSGYDKLRVAPTKAFEETYQKWLDEYDPSKAAKLDNKLVQMRSKTSLCGAVLTLKLLEHERSDIECFRTIRDIYNRTAEISGGIAHWRTGKKYTGTQVLLSEMQLLWMRRNKDPKDVLKWLYEKQD